MARNFYHGKDANIVAGAANFASLISSDPGSFGLSSAQSAAFGVLNVALRDAYVAANTPATRTSVAVQEKNQAMIAMRRNAVGLARIIYATPAVNDAQLVSLGLQPRAVPTARPVPANPPVVEVISVSGRLVNVRVHDPSTERRGKAFGALGANVFSFVGEAPPTDPRQYYFERMTTRPMMQIVFPNSVASGATVWLSASWVGARGQIGIACAPVSFTLQGGAIRAAA